MQITLAYLLANGSVTAKKKKKKGKIGGCIQVFLHSTTNCIQLWQLNGHREVEDTKPSPGGLPRVAPLGRQPVSKQLQSLSDILALGLQTIAT